MRKGGQDGGAERSPVIPSMPAGWTDDRRLPQTQKGTDGGYQSNGICRDCGCAPCQCEYSNGGNNGNTGEYGGYKGW
jgi:hypothetical protein